MAVDELSTSYHPSPAYFDDVTPKYTTQQGLWGGRPTVLRLLRGVS